MKTWIRLMRCPETALAVLLLVFIAGMATMYIWLKVNGMF